MSDTQFPLRPDRLRTVTHSPALFPTLRSAQRSNRMLKRPPASFSLRAEAQGTGSGIGRWLSRYLTGTATNRKGDSPLSLAYRIQ